MNIPLYLKRINFNKQIKPSKDVLFELQEKHLKSVPFENLDIHYNREIELDLEAIYEKIVADRRGGFCYELNGLFYNLLKEIGFEVKMISGRGYSKNEEYGKEYDHLGIIATIKNQDYLVDVGFGKFSLNPLEIKMGVKLKDKFGEFQFDNYDEEYLRINEVINGKLIPQYIFKTTKRKYDEFESMCTYQQTSKDSHFTQKKMISIATNDGRITLNENQLKITKGGIEEEIAFEEHKFETKLKQYFNIEM